MRNAFNSVLSGTLVAMAFVSMEVSITTTAVVTFTTFASYYA